MKQFSSLKNVTSQLSFWRSTYSCSALCYYVQIHTIQGLFFFVPNHWRTVSSLNKPRIIFEEISLFVPMVFQNWRLPPTCFANGNVSCCLIYVYVFWSSKGLTLMLFLSEALHIFFWSCVCLHLKLCVSSSEILNVFSWSSMSFSEAVSVFFWSLSKSLNVFWSSFRHDLKLYTPSCEALYTLKVWHLYLYT